MLGSIRRVMEDRDVNAGTSNGQRRDECNTGVTDGRLSLNGVNVSGLNISVTAIVGGGHVHPAALPLHLSAAATLCRRHSSIGNGAQHRRHEHGYENRHCCDDSMKPSHLVLEYLNKTPNVAQSV